MREPPGFAPRRPGQPGARASTVDLPVPGAAGLLSRPLRSGFRGVDGITRISESGAGTVSHIRGGCGDVWVNGRTA